MITISDTVYFCGDIPKMSDIVTSLEKREHMWLFFVYTTKNKSHMFIVAPPSAIKKSDEAVVVGIAKTRAQAFRIVCTLAKKRFA